MIDMDKMCLYFIINHSPSFVNFFGPVAANEYVRLRPYQYPAFLSEKRAVFRGGRRWGKTFLLIWKGVINILTQPHKSQLLTTLRRTHVQNVFEPIIDIFNSVRFLRRFYKTGKEFGSVKRDVVKSIDFINGHQYIAISVGDDPKAAQIKGQSPAIKYIDEAQDYPTKASEVLSSTEDPTGCEEYWAGVVDGRRDTPFYVTCERSVVFQNSIFKFSRRYDPHFNQENLKKALEQLGQNSNRFMQEVDAEHGDPEQGAWNMNDVLVATEGYDDSKVHDMNVISLTPQEYKRGISPISVVSKLRGNDKETIIGVDYGEVQPTVIMPFEKENGVWICKHRIEMRDRVDTDAQAKMLSYISNLYSNLIAVGIDCTSSPALADLLEPDLPEGKIVRVKFQANYPYGVMFIDSPEKQEMIFKESGTKPPIGAEIKRVMKVKNFTVSEGIKMLSRREVNFYYDPEIIEQFSAESEENGRIKTPPDVHIPEAFRCFVLAWHQSLRWESASEHFMDIMYPEKIETGYFDRSFSEPRIDLMGGSLHERRI